jgi:hypothetical protein
MNTLKKLQKKSINIVLAIEKLNVRIDSERDSIERIKDTPYNPGEDLTLEEHIMYMQASFERNITKFKSSISKLTDLYLNNLEEIKKYNN